MRLPGLAVCGLSAVVALPLVLGCQSAQQGGGPPATAEVEPQPPRKPSGPTRSATVIEAQRLLTKLGLDPGATDGRMGPRTRKALLEFQQSYRLPATGELTPDVLAELRMQAKARSQATSEEAGDGPSVSGQSSSIRKLPRSSEQE
jgi:peptidoglycan hydrolase-like protein with peptidoglycan-binding domain